MCAVSEPSSSTTRLQPAPVIFEQFGRPQVARDQHRILGQPGLGGGAHPPDDDPHQPVGQILEVVHPLLEQRIVDFLHPAAGALLDPLDRGLGGEAAVDRLVDPPRPAFVIGEHLVGLEDLIVLAGGAELGLAGHVVDLLAHPAEGGIDPRPLGLGILGDGMLDHHPRLVEHGDALGHAGDQLQPGNALRPGRPLGGAAAVGQAGAGDQFAQHHRHRLQRLDLDFLVAARIGMLDREHPDRIFAVDDRHAGETVEALLAGFGAIGEGRVAAGLGQVEDPPLGRDRPDQPLAGRQAGDVHRFLVQPVGGEQFQLAVALDVDRADLALHRLGDQVDDMVQLALRRRALGHQIVEADDDLARGNGGGQGHGAMLLQECAGLSKRRGRR